jgi:hypothetical protein
LVVIKKGVGYLITENQSLKNRKANSKSQIPEFCPLWREILGKEQFWAVLRRTFLQALRLMGACGVERDRLFIQYLGIT